MLFNKAEIDILKVVDMYMDAPAKMLEGELGKPFRILLEYGYLKFYETSASLRIADTGKEILSKAGIKAKKYIPATNDSRIMIRRLQRAEITMFFIRANIDVFSKSIRSARAETNAVKPLYISTSEMRRHKYKNVLGMSKFIGLLYTNDFTYAVYNVTNPAEMFYPKNDEDVFSREMICDNTPAKILYAADSCLSDMVQIYTESAKKSAKSKKQSFYKAISEFYTPVCLIPLNAHGLTQLQIMLIPNYKEKLAQYLLNSEYAKSKAVWADAVYTATGEYLIIFFDFDVKRLQKALSLTDKLLVYVLKEQESALDILIEGSSAEKCVISSDEVFDVLGIKPNAYRKTEPFLLSDGDGIYAEMELEPIKPNNKNK